MINILFWGHGDLFHHWVNQPVGSPKILLNDKKTEQYSYIRC